MTFQLLDRLRGTGRYSVAIPPMDGKMKPNDLIEHADIVAPLEAADNITIHQGELLATTRMHICKVTPSAESGIEEYASFYSEVTALASDGSDSLAIGLDGDGILVQGGKHDLTKITNLEGRPAKCVTALLFEGPDRLVVCLGSQHNSTTHWKRDLLEKRQSGSIWRIDLNTGRAELLQDRMAFPAGVAPAGENAVLVSEAWLHRITRIDASGTSTVLENFAAYPGRLTATPGGDYLVAAFAPRRQLVEFILHEPKFRARMLNEIPEEYWMAPALSSGSDFLEPLQGGQIRHHGVLKPWAPTRSYGLIVRMEAEGRITNSAHSRIGGRRHGITSALEHNGRVIATSRGAGQVISLDLGKGDSQ